MTRNLALGSNNLVQPGGEGKPCTGIRIAESESGRVGGMQCPICFLLNYGGLLAFVPMKLVGRVGEMHPCPILFLLHGGLQWWLSLRIQLELHTDELEDKDGDDAEREKCSTSPKARHGEFGGSALCRAVGGST